MIKRTWLVTGLVALAAMLSLGWEYSRAQAPATQPTAASAASAPALPPPARTLIAPFDGITITVYNTGDLHDQSGNLARIAAFVAKQRKEENVIFVDAGDFLNKGEPWQPATQGEGMIALMAACGYDAVAMGNHDYIFGKEPILDLVVKYPKFPLTLCNMRWSKEDLPRAKGIARYRIVELKGVKVAVVGSASHYTNHIGGVPFPMYHERDAYKELLPQLRAKADFVVFISHLFDGSDRNLLDAWKEDSPPVMIGAHTHGRLVTWVNNTLLVKGGHSGLAVGKTVIQYDPAAKRVVAAAAKTITVGKDWPEDEQVKALREKLMSAAAGGNSKP
ncbi:MAG: metallophosphoesterase [Planctomycetaceae bacterium]|nr:metallophosphoesterase [Planctomycetaceae bacterium]